MNALVAFFNLEIKKELAWFSKMVEHMELKVLRDVVEYGLIHHSDVVTRTELRHVREQGHLPVMLT